MTSVLPVAVALGLAAVALPAQDQPSSPPTCTVTLRVLEVDGNPIEGAGVAVTGSRSPTTDDALQRPVAKSDRDGALTFAVPVPAGRFQRARFLLAAPGRASIAVDWNRPAEPATAVHLGVVYLYPGATLRGRVRDTEGKPVAGARVEFREPCQAAQLPGASVSLYGVTTTDAHGIYALAGALTGPCLLSVLMPGYYGARLFPVWADTPASPVLEPSGFVSGKLVDLDPRVCRVVLNEEDPAAVYFPAPPVGADGSFRLPITGRGRAHLQVYSEPGYLLADTLVQGPVDGIELRPTTHPVRVVITAAGKPVPKFTVQPAWGAKPGNQMEWHVHFPLRLSGTDGVDGEATVPMPATVECGLLQVKAEGFAIARVEVASATVAEVRCELQPGAVVKGVVTDDRGAPLAGARAFVQGLPQPARSISGGYAMAQDPVITGADGSFRIDGLPAGRFAVVIDHPDCEVPEPRARDVAAGQHVALEPLALVRRGEIRGRLRGSIPPGALLGVAAPDQWNQRGGLNYQETRPRSQAQIAADGRFVLPGLPHSPQRLVLLLPPTHPAGTAIELPIGSFTAAAEEQPIDVRGAEPATLRGRIEGAHGDAVRSWRVVALRKTNGPFALPCAYADVASDGRYAMRLQAGDYRLGITDRRSGVVLYRHADALTLAPGQVLEGNLEPELREVTVQLQLPDAEKAVTGSLQLREPDQRAQSMTDFLMLRSDSSQRLPLLPGELQLRFYLPAGNFIASVVGYTMAAAADGSNRSRLGETEFTVDDAPLTVPLPLTPGPGAGK